MSKENVQKFYEKAMSDEGLQGKLMGLNANREGIIPLAKAEGFEFTAEDLKYNISL